MIIIYNIGLNYNLIKKNINHINGLFYIIIENKY